MNILLPTYSYFPYNFGGTEVYVAGLARYLFSQGHSVTIIAGTSPKAFIDHEIFFEDAQIKTVRYKVDDITVIGVIMKDSTTSEIYRKYRPQADISWSLVFARLSSQKWDILHFNAYTSAIGQNILYAIKKHSATVKVFFSYHLPVSCIKNTLLYSNLKEACTVKPSVNICTACYLAGRQNISVGITKPLVQLIPVLNNEKLPFFFNLKYLVQVSINAFQELISAVDKWFVFSEQIDKILLLNGVKQDNIFALRHGVDNVFSDNFPGISKMNKNTNQLIFLYVGRFEKIKGFDTLLKSWCGLKEEQQRKLEIIGEMQTENTDIKKLIEIASHRKDIIWHGKKTQKEIASIMEYTHCTIIPSQWIEIGPLVFHEAISKGNDVIAADIGGCKSLAELYSKKSTLFRTGNIKSLQQAIIDFKYSHVKLPVITQIENYRMVEKVYQQIVIV